MFLRSLPAVIACKLIAFFAMGVYRGIWGFMSTDDVYVCLKGSMFASLLSVVAVTYIYRFEDFSKGIFIIDWLLTTGYLLGTRGSFRLFLDTIKRKTLSGDAVFIYGAGRGGEILLREILNNRRLNIKPVGFIDDDTLKTGKKLLGYPVLGSSSDIEGLSKKYPITGILVSFRNHDPDKLHSIKLFCEKNRLFLKRFSICFDDLDVEAG